jgi:dTDP-4-dehydrorhamnose 3,5-epimerase
MTGVIAGVTVRRLEPHVDERGSLTEVLRSDWPEFTRFGQAIVTVNLPWVVRAWHWHRQQTDVVVVVSGRAVVALYDARDRSPTRGAVLETVADGREPVSIFVPPGVYHGYQTIGDRAAIIMNFPDRTYDPSAPDEERVRPDAPGIPYRWRAPDLEA